MDRLFGELAAADLPVPSSARVIARGRQRRRRTRTRAVLAVAAATALVVAGASQLAGARTRKPVPAGHVRAPHAVCSAAPDPALTAQLARRLPLRGQVVALAPDGTLAYALVSEPGFRGIAAEKVATGAVVRHIERLSSVFDSAAGTLTRTGDLLWISRYSTAIGANSGSSPVRMWSPRTGVVTMLEPPGQSGAALSAPVLYQGGGIAAWLQGDGQQREIVAANLDTGNVHVIATGYLGPPVFVGDALVWSAASTVRGYPAHLVATDATPFPSRQRIAVPAPLRSARGGVLMGSMPEGTWTTPIGLIASAGGAAAYFSASLTELFYSPAATQPARLVLRLKGGAYFAPGSLAMGDGYLAWSTASAASYVASASSLAVATITNGNTQYGSLAGFAGYVLATRTASPKHGVAPVYLLRGSTIDGLSCERR